MLYTNDKKKPDSAKQKRELKTEDFPCWILSI